MRKDQELYSFIRDDVKLRNMLNENITLNSYSDHLIIFYSMLNNRLFSKTIPLWDTCIEILLKSHLPTKFALTGRLSLNDLTQDGFYVSKTNVCPYVNFCYITRKERLSKNFL